MATEQKTRNESQRPREKWGAYRSGDANLVPRALFPGFGGGAGKRPGDEVVGTPTKSLLAFSDLLAGKKIFFSNSLCTYQLLHVFCQQKGFFSRFRATSQEQENKLAMHSGIAAYKKKNSSFTYRRRFPFSDLT